MKNQTDKEKIEIARKCIHSKPMNALIFDDYLERLVFQHPEAEKKIGPGIFGFKVKQNRLNKKAKELWIVRKDQTEVDVSFITCATGKPKSSFHNRVSAMRHAVIPQIDQFRKQSQSLCSNCGKDAHHVDHVNYFETLVGAFYEFCNDMGIRQPNEFDDCPETNMAKYKTTDVQIRDLWIEFHQTHADLRMLCQSCNLSRSRSADGGIESRPSI